MFYQPLPTQGQPPNSLIEKCNGFFHMYYTTHGTNGFTPHPKDEAIKVFEAYSGTSLKTSVQTETRTHTLLLRNTSALDHSMGYSNNIAIAKQMRIYFTLLSSSSLEHLVVRYMISSIALLTIMASVHSGSTCPVGKYRNGCMFPAKKKRYNTKT